MIVLDASASLGWSFRDQRTPELVELSKLVLARGATAPQLWPIEVTNVVVRTRRRGKIGQAECDGILMSLRALKVRIDAETGNHIWDATVRIADKHKLTIYDATYLELALRMRLPLATRDDELIIAARAEGLTVLP